MENRTSYEDLLAAEMKKYPSLLIWDGATKLVALVPGILYLLILTLISIENPEALSTYTLRGLLYFACYGGFLKTVFELEKIDSFVVIFGLGTVAFFVNNLFYTGMISVIGVIIDMFIVWVAVAIYNYKKARNDAQMAIYDLNRYETAKKQNVVEKEAKVQANSQTTKKVVNSGKDIESQASFSKAFEEFQKNNK